MTATRFRDARTGEIVSEPTFAEGSLRWFYEDPFGKRVFHLFLNRPWFSRLYGWLQDRPKSVERIAPFVATFGVDLGEAVVPESGFTSFNAFFTRALKPGARDFGHDPTVFPSPADGKVLAYAALGPESRIPVKGACIGLAELFGSEALASRYVGGSALVVRLAVQDYHRFHFPVAGVAGPARAIAGSYHSVGPIARAQVPDLFCKNKRAVTEIETEQFGHLAYVEVGALCVGTIHQTYTPGPVARGQEKGYFSFGGSTLVLVFEGGAIAFDPALLEDTAQEIEVAVRAGMPLGRKP